MASTKTVDFTVIKGSKDGNLVASQVKKEIGSGQVLLQVTHSGLCGTDIHHKHMDMGLGHEGVGVVKEVGPNVSLLKIGDRVGWGYQHSSCGHCKQCQRGFETFCPERAMYGYADLDQGSMSTHAIWKEEFLFKIPEGIDSESAAPLMCGGATVYNAFVQGSIRPAETVAVFGIGGLGHLAIQYAQKMGCRVVVLSGTESKRAEAMSLGASEFFATKDVKDLTTLGVPPIDHLLVCTSFQPDWSQVLSLMAPTGIVYPLSVSAGDFVMPYMPLLASGLRIQGCLVAARQVHREMLEFSARHGVKPMVERFPMTVEGAKAAFEKLENGQMRYRGVLVGQ